MDLELMENLRILQIGIIEFKCYVESGKSTRFKWDLNN